MNKLGARLLGEEARYPLEQRIFHVVMVTGIVLTVFATVMDAVYRNPIWVDLAFLTCWTLIYGLSRFGQAFRIVSAITVVLIVFGFLPYQWVLSRGIAGAFPVYTVLFVAVLAMILRGWLRTATLVSTALVVALLVGYDASIGLESWQIAFRDWYLQLLVALAAIALLVIYFSNAYAEEKERSEDYAKTIEAHIRQQVYYVENLEGLIGKLRSERHDFNNHLNVMHWLLESSNSDKAKAYAAQLVKEATEYRNIVDVPYPAVRVLLNHKLGAARENGIALKLDVGLPEGLDVNEFDLTVILGNLLDNAVEACGKLATGDPYIDLALRFQPDYLIIRVANPCITSPNGHHRSTKADPDNHGFGLKNVEYFVHKHEGLMEIQRDDGVFRVDIALPV